MSCRGWDTGLSWLRRVTIARAPGTGRRYFRRMTTAISNRRVLVVGGGIGGLAVARGLLAQGADVVIVERAAEFSAAGAGIVLAANATAVLDALGIDVTQHGRSLPGMSIADHRGRTLQQARADELQADYRTIRQCTVPTCIRCS
jgi:2-polyprenyl-6-methoxyphenol hydroxylase-like FAD-dependent oxidoreductase